MKVDPGQPGQPAARLSLHGQILCATFWKESGARSLRGGGNELDKLKTLTSSSNYFAQNIN